jgi:hypothetical protein
MEQILTLQNNFKQAMTEFKLKIRSEGEGILKNELQKGIDEIRAKYPDFPIQDFVVRWTQYTPYFNDGDECVFNCHFDLNYCLHYIGSEFTDLEDEDSYYEGYVFSCLYDVGLKQSKFGVHESFEKYTEPLKMVYELIERTIYQLDKDSFEILWDDHSEIEYSFATNSFERNDCHHE